MVASQGKQAPGRSIGFALAGLMLASAPALHASQKKIVHKDGVIAPTQVLTLASIGAPVPSVNLITQGASLLTVNLIDDTHLLVTFATRDLVPRIPDDPPTDEDRILAGEIVELPSGKVLAKTKWHVHDQARYLWPLGHGRFVLRIRNDLSLLEPLHDLQGQEAFQRIAIPHAPGMPLGIVSTMNGDVLSVTTQEPAPPQQGVKVLLGDTGDNQPKPAYDIAYFRVRPQEAGQMALLEPAGHLRIDIPVLVPMDADGYLWEEEDTHHHGEWTVTFNSFDGGTRTGGVLDSTCFPLLRMTSRSEYLAFTCRGGLDGDDETLRSLGLDGHETWEEDFGQFVETPAFVFAPQAARFAVSLLRTTTEPGDLNAPAAMGSLSTTPTPDPVTSTNQEVRVYQNASGDLLARVALSPAFRVAENFDLSSDGLVLAAVQNNGIAIFSLPPLTKEDKTDIAEVAAFAPPVATTAAVTFPRLYAVAATSAAATAAASAKQALAAPVSTTTQAPLPATASDAANEGDIDSTGQRKRPTLLNPGEKPEFKDKSQPPQ